MNLKELAAHLNLSQTTVSRALNGYPEVSEKTRNRVRLAAEKVGYRPSLRAKSLATGRAMTIGHVLPVSTKHEMVNPIFGDFIAGAGETYSRHGYDLMLRLVPDIEEERTYRDLKASGSIDGVVLHGPSMGDRRIALLSQIGLPFVVHGRASDLDVPYSWLDLNNADAFRRATDFLLDLGHRRIALVNGLATLDFAHNRRAGYATALQAREIALDEALIRNDEMTELYGFRAARDLLALPDPPTAFLVSSMIAAIGVRRAIGDAGLRMGRDVSVVTHDDDLSYMKNGNGVPLFTATRSSARQAGREVAEMILQRIENPAGPPLTKLLEPELTVGASTGPARPGRGS